MSNLNEDELRHKPLAVTKDGIPVYNGMKQYYIHPETGKLMERRAWFKESRTVVCSSDDDDDFWELYSSDCFSTPEAAWADENRRLSGN